ncbi:MAG: phenylalanine--tRNA ligase subunit beta [Candidatus Aenigmarchaeota archaeon]|nr:phenylalanine--tRNA ligase subunit beta [Candidatus Aenigmarchaeota archaeon]
MPVITFDVNDFCKLVGKDIQVKEIEEKLPMLGVGVENIEKDEFSVEVNPNRPDMLSVEGLARAFSSFMDINTGLKTYKAEKSIYFVKADSTTKTIRPYIVCAVVTGVEMTDEFIKSLMQIQEKLHVTHCRKRKKAAIGVHDLDKVKFPILYTAKDTAFKFIPLGEEKEMTLDNILKHTPKGKDYGWILKGMDKYPILIDSDNKVMAMPPIINSTHTMVDEKTKNLFIDITGTDDKTINEVLNIVVTSLADRDGKIQLVKVKYPDREIETPKIGTNMMNLEPNYVNKLLGIKLTNYEMIEYLQKMGFDAVEVGKNIQVVIPCYRTDIMHAMDLVEDIAIAYGYDRFKPEIPNISTIGEEDQLESFSTKLRTLLVGYGLQEVTTFILTNKDNLYKKMKMEEKDVIETANPKTEEYNIVRNWFLPSLMEVLWRNRHREYSQNIFEVGDVIELSPSSETGAKTMRRLGIVLCHSKANFSEIKSMVESILSNLGVKDYKIEESTLPCFIPGRAAKIVINEKNLGRFGEINPEVVSNWELEMPAAACEICVNSLFNSINSKTI